MLQRLEREQEEIQAEVEDLHSKLTELWHRLHEDYAHRENFLGANKGFTKSTLKAVSIAFYIIRGLFEKFSIKYITDVTQDSEQELVSVV